MIAVGDAACPSCGGGLKHYDSIRRIVRTKTGKKRWIKIRRLMCLECGAIHNELPNYLAPYKHYEIDIIRGFIFGSLSSADLDFEDFPCETTIKRWKSTDFALTE